MSNRRKYIRIGSVLPVEFIISASDSKKITPWLQGFTHDIGSGGICLVVNDLWWEFAERLNRPGSKIFLKIELFLSGKKIYAEAKVVWIKKSTGDDCSQYILGLEFLTADKKQYAKLFGYALTKKILPLIATGIVLGLAFFSWSIFWKSDRLIKENKKLVKDYISILDKSSLLENSLIAEQDSANFLKSRQNNLQDKIVKLQDQINLWQAGYTKLERQLENSKIKDSAAVNEVALYKQKINDLEQELTQLKRENEFIKTKEKESKDVAKKIEVQAKNIAREKMEFSQKIIDGVYNWIKNRQDLISGIVLSYEGDKNLEKVCFTYDQALAAITFIIFDDTLRAKKILDFYNQHLEKEDIYNAYYTNGSVFEYVSHSGPNAWLGLAALTYVKKTQDKQYLNIAQKAADFLIKMMDKEGGIIGGPTVTWYSTEHNLDAVAFFNLFYELTNDKKYLNYANKITGWLNRYSYTDQGPFINRGKGDSTIATDTYAWSVTALGPDSLKALNMNPDSILEFAIENCEIETKFFRGEGEVKVRGFDFAKFKNTARGGVISGEWTAQMILSFEIMADYYRDKDPVKYNEYIKKSLFYFNELQKMLITSPSKIGREDPCLPYASSESADTGHGWRTPWGSKTGSLSSSAYFLIAYSGYNPLTAKQLNISLKELYKNQGNN